MAITEDTANQPAPLTWTGAWTTAVTTASFSPQANTLLVALVVGDGTASAAVTGNVTDSLSGTWTMACRANTSSTGANGGTAEVWYRYLSSAPGSMTVSVHATGAGASTGGQMVVRCLLGAASTQTGAATATKSNASAAALDVSITASAAGNMIYGAIEDYDTNTTLTMVSGTTSIANDADATNGDTYAAVKSTSTTTTTATTYGSSTSAHGQVALAEILAAAGGGGTAASGSATLTLTGAGDTQAAATGSATVTLTGSGAASAPGQAVGSATLTLTATGTAVGHVVPPRPHVYRFPGAAVVRAATF